MTSSIHRQRVQTHRLMSITLLAVQVSNNDEDQGLRSIMKNLLLSCCITNL